jgi:hypothetical protein
MENFGAIGEAKLGETVGGCAQKVRAFGVHELNAKRVKLDAAFLAKNRFLMSFCLIQFSKLFLNVKHFARLAVIREVSICFKTNFKNRLRTFFISIFQSL